MAIRRKGTRKIAVGIEVYRWTVAPDDELGLAIVVELYDRPRGRLVSWVDHGVIISPSVVRSAIEHGKARGWDPMNGGPEHVQRLYGLFPRQAKS